MIDRGRSLPAGILVGFLADALLADPRRGHPVAGFGWCATGVESLTYRDDRVAGVVHTALLVGGLAGAATLAGAGVRNPWGRAGLTAVATWVALGGTTLARTGSAMADLLEDGDIDAARALLPSLCGRDPAVLDGAGLARAACESVAENTSDAQVAPLFWAALTGVPGVLAYRAINTLDAMIGHRSARYARFGWAAARLDDIANYLPARLTGTLALVCAPLVGGSPGRAVRAWRRDAGAPPEPERRSRRGDVRRRARRAAGRTDSVPPPTGDPADPGGGPAPPGPRTCVARCGCRGWCRARRSRWRWRSAPRCPGR